ncbi:MAG: hypothetical protein AAFX93_10855 [Verrucomicrobiota bacterium]
MNDLIIRYQSARGEYASLRNLKSIGIEGETIQGNLTFTYKLNQRDSGEIRYEVSCDGESVIQVFDGSKAWRWVAGNPEKGARELDPKALRFFRIMNSYLTPLDKPFAYGFRAELLGLEMPEAGSEDQAEYHIRLTNPREGDILDIWLNGVTFLESRRAYRPSADEKPLEFLFEDYRAVRGINIPHRIRTYFDDKMIAMTTVREVDTNEGLLSFYFTKPTSYKVVDNEGN